MVPCISNSTQKVGGDEIVESTMEVDETETIEVSWSEATDISLTRPRPAKKDSPHHCLKRSMNVENPSRLLLLDQRPAKKVRRTEAIRHPKATRSVLLIDLSGISHQLLKLLSSIRRSKNQRRLSDEPCLHSFMISVNRLPNAPRLVGPCWIQNLLHSFQETACQSDKRLDSIKGLRMVNGHKADSSLTPASSWKGRFFGLNVGTRATRARTLDREKGAMVVYTRGFNPPFFGLSISGNNAIVPQTKLAPSKRLQTNPRAAIDPPPSESFQVDGVEQPQDCPKQSPMQEMESLDTSSKKVNTFAASISGQKLPPNTPKRAFVKHPGPSEAKPNHSLLSPTALVRDKNEAAASNVPRGESTGFTQKLDESIAISLSTGYFMSTTTEGEREVAVQTSSQSRSTAHQPEGSRQDQASRQASPMTSKPISVGRSGPSSDTTERQRPSSPLSFHSGGREEAKRPTTSFPGAQIQNRLYREGLSSPYLAKVCSPSNSMTQAKSNKSEKTLSIFDETEANPKQTSLIESNKKSQQPNESTPWLAAAEGSRNVIDAKIDKEIQNHIQLDPEAAYLVDAPEDCSPRSHHSSLSRRSEQQSACLATPLQESSPRCQLSSLIQQSDKQQNEGTFDDTKNGRSRQEQPARYPVTTIPEPKSYAMTAVSEQRFAREQMTKEERKREKKRKRKERKEKKKLKKERKRERKRKKSSSGRAIPVEDGAASSGEEEVVLVGVRNSPANSAGHDGTGRPRSQAEAHSKASIAAVKFRSEQPIRQEKSPENGVSRATRTDNRCDGSNISVNCAPPAASDGPDGLLGAFRRQQVNTQLPQTKKIETEKQFGANLKERKTPDALATMISTQQNAPQSPNVYRTQLGTGLNAADTTYRGYNELNNGPYEESNVPRSNATDYSIRHHSPASGNKFSRLPPIELLCSETFIEKWSEPIAELATGKKLWAAF